VHTHRRQTDCCDHGSTMCPTFRRKFENWILIPRKFAGTTVRLSELSCGLVFQRPKLQLYWFPEFRAMLQERVAQWNRSALSTCRGFRRTIRIFILLPGKFVATTVTSVEEGRHPGFSTARLQRGFFGARFHSHFVLR